MKAKYRILEKDGKFYPQVKYLFVWLYFEEAVEWNSIFSHHVSRENLERAEGFIENKIKSREQDKSIEKNIKIHSFDETKNS